MGTTAKLFLTDYASYNEGTQFEHGHWVELSDFSDADEFQKYVSEHFEKVGIEDAEPMYTDFEGFPDYLYGESLSGSDLEKIFKYIELDFENKSDDEKISLWNEYCSENSMSDYYTIRRDDFFNMFFDGKEPMEIFRLGCFSQISWSDEYIKFNGYGNLESMNTHEAVNSIDETVLIEWLMDNL